MRTFCFLPQVYSRSLRHQHIHGGLPDLLYLN
ncbi:hypothetical protein CTAM01_17136 [Colletotrichum tamarilloi]|uniref:Uncharacterized protein n=1 Tax=Colletotrichum tamarilloi TaxID=1209934 RepID=A0ABQ9QFS9_9PEZI|nr:uncharacterized protein CTAM01_17370 [Colletotrichum tamarilloi]XP_060372178.1 uncharacterized protein CTAM01_17257 [Colletotrichum tamarilloi]XP_060372192.1 uncharacterized protein CTAM01_17242 [Colletotrichum tamarilloi]XP_060372232.1 uncharacterized protein CTAM01_17203 [Colletotrichum tamarilloi]XP_060372298.1 uncharacterized protein CTAM01_17136 [Colletotrichum tamarilloi]KAK1446721.1 hypothetical protein CTAM01_17370 [Colletotrichum tamarilloi]KAK1452814.1 hypothetical protein CTAM01